MRNAEFWHPEAIGEFLEASQAPGFAGQNQERSSLGDLRQAKKRRGVIRAYLHKVTGKSLSQIRRLILRHRKTGCGPA